MPLFAWTAAFAVYIAAAAIVVMIGLRLAIVRFTVGRTRLICDALFALLGLAVLSLFWL